MEVRFADHASYQRAAAWSVGAGAVLGMAGLLPWLAAWAAWSAAGCGAVLTLALNRAAARAAKESGTTAPSLAGIAAAIVAVMAACALAFLLLPHLDLALRAAVPGWTARAVCGAALGLWAALASFPLHVRLGGDPVEDRLAILRLSLDPALRGLVERAGSARRGAAVEIPRGACAELRGLIDSLTLTALDRAGRAQQLSRAAAPEVADELQQRTAALRKAAADAGDPAASKSYLQAAETIAAQLSHWQRVRCARERMLARLHEDVAVLERARFSLTLVRGSDGAAALAVLQDQLKAGAAAFEESDALAAPADPVRA